MVRFRALFLWVVLAWTHLADARMNLDFSQVSCDYVVSYTTGSDWNQGSVDKPFKTIKRAFLATRGRGPKVICLRSDGVHYTQETIFVDQNHCGTSAAPFVLMAYPPDLVTTGVPQVSGGVALSQWKQGSNGMYTHEAPKNCDRASVLVQTAPTTRTLQRARMPRKASGDTARRQRYMGDDSTFKWADTLRPCTSGGFEHTCPPEDAWGLVYNASDPISPTLYAVDEIQALVFHSWTAFWSNISHINGTNHSIVFSSAHEAVIGQFEGPSGRRYILENVKEGLDEPGEWYWDTKEQLISYIPQEGDAVDNFSVVAPQVQVLLQVYGAQHVHVANIEFAHASLGDRTNQYHDAVSAINVQNSFDVTFAGVSVTHSAGSGWGLDENLDTVAILGCAATHLGGDGIQMMSATNISNILINNTFVNDTAHIVMGQPGGMRLQGERGIVATHNTVGFCPYAGIMLGWQTGHSNSSGAAVFEVKHNVVHDYGLGILSDFGGIYISSSDNLCFQKDPVTCFLPALIQGNVIRNCSYYNYGCNGIYHDEQVSGVVSDSNIIVDIESEGIYFHCGTGNVATNNIFANAGAGGTHHNDAYVGSCNSGGNPTWPEVIHGFTFERNIVYVSGGTPSNPQQFIIDDDYRATLFQNNTYFSPDSNLLQHLQFGNKTTWIQWRATGNDTASILADPLFANASEKDFRLSAKSPSFGLGTRSVAWMNARTCAREDSVAIVAQLDERGYYALHAVWYHGDEWEMLAMPSRKHRALLHHRRGSTIFCGFDTFAKNSVYLSVCLPWST
eukprot:m.746736 g.746736  ORF g.746736 m.746736 type:complete len:789 (-) comp23140_c0_seq3:3444-5810(-)